MGPHDTLPLVLSILAAIAAPVGCLLLWGRVLGPAVVRVAQRVSLILVCQLTALLVVGLSINDTRDFYDTWSDLLFDWGLGGDVNNGPGQIEGAGPGLGLGHHGHQFTIDADFRFHSDTKTYTATVVGPQSRIRGDVVVWLPPGYNARQDVRYPVIELFSGTPGTPAAWFGPASGLEIGKQVTGLMSTGRVRPFILVSAQINLVRGTPDECTDVPGQPKVATWLTHDIRQLMRERFHVRDDPGSWGVMGYSEGAYCAIKLAAQYPHYFHAGVGIAGTYKPSLPAVTGDPALLKANDPATLVRDRPPVALMFATTARDPEAPVSAFTPLLTEARPPTVAKKLVLPNGGHFTRVWGTMLPTILPWLSQQLAGIA